MDGFVIILRIFPFNVNMKSIFVRFANNGNRLNFGQVDLVFGKSIQDARQRTMEMANFKTYRCLVSAISFIALFREDKETGIIFLVGFNPCFEDF